MDRTGRVATRPVLSSPVPEPGGDTVGRMTTYVALLRGINLGAKRRVAMSDLRAWLTDLGYGDVRTHLQSGNAVFTSRRSARTVGAELEARLAAETGFTVDCVIRTAEQMRAVAECDPFGEVVTNPSRYLVAFLDQAPEPALLPDADPAGYAPERVYVGEREVYFWCPEGVADSLVLAAFSERRLGVVATVRNWNTVTKLRDLVSE
jgi:uncharacterized protein (DUF1697 family)